MTILEILFTVESQISVWSARRTLLEPQQEHLQLLLVCLAIFFKIWKHLCTEKAKWEAQEWKYL